MMFLFEKKRSGEQHFLGHREMKKYKSPKLRKQKATCHPFAAELLMAGDFPFHLAARARAHDGHHENPEMLTTSFFFNYMEYI